MYTPPGLTDIPTDIQHLLLGILPNFGDLGAMILTHRVFHDIYQERKAALLQDVARNFLGPLLDESILLVRAQEAKSTRKGGKAVAAVPEGFSSTAVLLLMNNDCVVKALEVAIFGLLKVDTKEFDIYDGKSLRRFADEPFTVDASPTESIRFQAAAYRFWRFCLQSRKQREPSLKALTTPALLELECFVQGISNLIYAMRGQPQESDHDWDFISSVQSAGPLVILALWIARGDSEKYDEDEFSSWLGWVGTGEEGFFDYPCMDAKESMFKNLANIDGIGSLTPILDADNAKMKEILANSTVIAHDTVSS
ncbi:hypothetical protein C8R46DRAFT_1354360 [Mycena filopes]|nr:hypothetical protein C8R46DRAFT_1354360 [Mycena filopes]